MAKWEEVLGQADSRAFREKHPEVAGTLDALSGLELIFPVSENADIYFSQLLLESWQAGLINDAERPVIAEALHPYLASLEEARLKQPKRLKGIEKGMISPERLREFASGLQPGEIVELTFRKDPRSSALDVDAMLSLRILLSIGAGNVLLLGDRLALMAVVASGDWDIVSPTVRVKIGDSFDPEWFAGRFGKGLDKVRVVPR